MGLAVRPFADGLVPAPVGPLAGQEPLDAPGGSWDERTGAGITRQALYTGTGFPRVFYLSYNLYRQYFPLMALTGYLRAMERAPLGAGG